MLNKAIKKSGIVQISEIDALVLQGGSFSIPYLKKQMEKAMKRHNVGVLVADELPGLTVAYGAACRVAVNQGIAVLTYPEFLLLA